MKKSPEGFDDRSKKSCLESLASGVDSLVRLTKNLCLVALVGGAVAVTYRVQKMELDRPLARKLSFPESDSFDFSQDISKASSSDDAVLHEALPLESTSYVYRAIGEMSFYDEPGNLMANMQYFDGEAFTIAHRTLPLGSRVQLTNPETGESVWVEVTDRGPYESYGDHIPHATRHCDATTAVVHALGGDLRQGIFPGIEIEMPLSLPEEALESERTLLKNIKQSTVTVDDVEAVSTKAFYRQASQQEILSVQDLLAAWGFSIPEEEYGTTYGDVTSENVEFLIRFLSSMGLYTRKIDDWFGTGAQQGLMFLLQAEAVE